jgi:hypothetical protein
LDERNCVARELHRGEDGGSDPDARGNRDPTFAGRQTDERLPPVLLTKEREDAFAKCLAPFWRERCRPGGLKRGLHVTELEGVVGPTA